MLAVLLASNRKLRNISKTNIQELHVKEEEVQLPA